MSEKKKYRLTGAVTISIHCDVMASSEQEAIELGKDMSMCAIHESEHSPDPGDGDWHTSGELDGCAFDIRVES